MARHTFQRALLAITLASTLSLSGSFIGIEANSRSTVEAILFNTVQKSFLIKNSGPARATVNSFSVAGNRRVIIDIENAEIGLSMPRDGLLYRELVSRWPSVKNITINQFGGARPVVRILLDIQGEDYVPELVQASGNALELRLNQAVSRALPAMGSTPKNLDPFPKETAQPQGLAPVKTVESVAPQAPQHAAKTYPEDQPVYTEKPVKSEYTATSTGDVPHIKLVELQRTKEDLVLARQKSQEQASTIAQLQTQINELNGKLYPQNGPSVDELKRTLIVLNQKYDDLTSENQRLRSQATQASETLAKTPSSSGLQEQINSLKRQITQQQEAIRRQTDEAESAKSQLKTAKTENLKLTTDLKKVQRDKNDLVSQHARANKAVETSSDEYQTLKGKLDEAKNELVQAAELIRKQNQDIKNLNEKMAKVSTGENATYKEQLTYLNTKLEEKEVELQRLKTQGQGMLPSGVKPDEAYVSLSQKYDQLIRDNKTLKEQLALAESQPKEIEAPVGKEKDRTRFLEEQLTQARQAMNSQDAQLKELRASLRNKPTSKGGSVEAQLKKQLDEKDRQVAELEKKLIALGSDSSEPSPELSAKYEARIKSIEVLHKDEMDQLKKEMAQQDKQMDELYAQLEQVKGTATAKGNTSNKGKSPQKPGVNTEAQALVALRSERDALVQEKALAEQALIDLKQQQDLSNSGIAELKIRNDSLSRQLSDLTDKYQMAVSESVTVKEQLKVLKAPSKPGTSKNAFEQEAKSLQVALSQKTNEILKLQKKLENLQTKASAPAGNQAQIEQLQAERDKLTDNLTSTESKLTMLQSEIDRLKAATPAPPDASHENESVNQSKEMLVQAKRQIKDLEQQLALLHKGHKPEVEAIDLRAVQDEKEDNAKRLANAEKLIQELQDQLKKKGNSKTAPAISSATIGAATAAMNSLSSSANSGGSGNKTVESVEATYTQARQAEKDGQWEAALTGYRQAYRSAPTVSKYVISLAQALLHEQNYDEAIQALETFLDQEPGNKEAYSQLGKAYLLAGRVEDANQMFASAVPTATLSNYATSLKKLGKMSEAEKVLKMALEVQPNDTDLLFNLGNLYNTTNNFTLAKETYLKALSKKQDFPEAHYNLGLLYSKTNEPKNASAHLERYLELVPDSPNKDAVKTFLKKLKP